MFLSLSGNRGASRAVESYHLFPETRQGFRPPQHGLGRGHATRIVIAPAIGDSMQYVTIGNEKSETKSVFERTP